MRLRTPTRVAVVTGGSAGIGRATVRELARRGHAIGVLARGHDGLDATAQEVTAIGGRAVALPTDVADSAAVEVAADAIESELGPIDVWVNDAMTSVFGPFKDITPGDFKRVTDVTYVGTVNGTRAALRRMQPRNRGVIIQVGSALAYRSIPLQAAYCGAKHAVRGFTESVRTELLHEGSGISLCEVHMPAVNTPQFRWVKSLLPNEAQPVPPIFQPEVAADAICWLVEHPRREMWVGFPTVGGILADRVVPGLLDRYLARTGYRSQQTHELRDLSRSNNLYGPVAGDHGARGAFDDRAKARSWQLAMTKYRGAVAAGLAITLALLGRRASGLMPRIRSSASCEPTQ